MSRKDIDFKTHDNVTLRGWLYTPSTSTHTEEKLPCLIMTAGWAALKEMSLDKFAEEFVQQLPLACLIYDHRSFGSSDTAPGQPQYEIIPSIQMSDMQDAITYAQGLPNIDPSKIGLWGSSYTGGQVLQVTASDKRVKAVISQAPLVSGYETLRRLIRPDILPGIIQMFNGDRLARASGQTPAVVPVSDQNPMIPSALPSAEAFAFFSAWEGKLEGKWKNQVTVRSLEATIGFDPISMISRISPVPLLMVVAKNDVTTPSDMALDAYHQAREPKQLVLLSCGHFEVYSDETFIYNSGKQIEWLKENFL
ncbi:Polyketide transferase [Lachnellula occidentalis]|uniref:Polyketide transferase n=1 Tax=Lachnellula occidentalis TaxID=215460 RepID=A0A8H8RSC8_9HELO|nr:Polyketide transferase [Lachnellula occidentalis]